MSAPGIDDGDGVAGRRAGGRATDDRGDGHPALRRVFVHALALLGLMLSASGTAGLLRLVLELLGGPRVAGSAAGGLALGLSLLIVGLPVWLVAWRAAQRGVADEPRDARSRPRRLFLAVVRIIALAIASFHAFEVGAWLLGVDAYDAAALARLAVWGVVWGYHERVAAEVPFGTSATRRLDRLYLYLVSTVGLISLAGGAGSALAGSLERLYDRLVRPASVLIDGGTGLRTALLGAAIGALVWWWHWGVRARDDRHATGWHVHLFLVGVLGGAVTAVVGASQLVYGVLVWLLFAVEGPLDEHFASAPAAVATLLVGLVVWGYHRAVVREQAPSGTWSGPERVYRHLMVAVGVLTTAGGVATVLTFGLEVVLPSDTLVDAAELGRRALAAGLTLLLIGVPLWATGWTRIERVAAANPRERRSGARRALIFGMFGLSTLVATGALGTLLYTSFEALFSGTWSLDVLADQRWSLALLLTAGAISAHYGLVLGEDRRALPAAEPDEEQAAPPTLQRVTVLAARPHALARQLADDLDVPVDAWIRLDAAAVTTAVDDEEGVVVDLDALVARLRELEAPEALVEVSPSRLDGAARPWEVVPLERDADR